MNNPVGASARNPAVANRTSASRQAVPEGFDVSAQANVAANSNAAVRKGGNLAAFYDDPQQPTQPANDAGQKKTEKKGRDQKVEGAPPTPRNPVRPLNQTRFWAAYKEFVEMDTSDSTGNTKRIVDAAANRLKAAGLDEKYIKIYETQTEDGRTKYNLLALLPGKDNTRNPMVLLAHNDVVNTPREGWNTDPFEMTEKDGFIYGRGVADNKLSVTSFVLNAEEYLREGFVPDYPILIALTADEELGPTAKSNGARYLAENFQKLVGPMVGRDDVKPAFVINEGGYSSRDASGKVTGRVQLAEKIYQDFRLDAKGTGGHSSAPPPDNEHAVFRINDAIRNLKNLNFTIRKPNEVVRAIFEKKAPTEKPEVQAAIAYYLDDSKDPDNKDKTKLKPLLDNPAYRAYIISTCTPTQLTGAPAPNALPTNTTSTWNCRIMPGESVAAVQDQFVKLVNDPNVTVTPTRPALLSPATSPNAALMNIVAQRNSEIWPGSETYPEQTSGASDAAIFRAMGVDAFGVHGMILAPQAGLHGLNERIGKKDAEDARTFLYYVVKDLATTDIYKGTGGGK